MYKLHASDLFLSLKEVNITSSKTYNMCVCREINVRQWWMRQVEKLRLSLLCKDVNFVVQSDLGSQILNFPHDFKLFSIVSNLFHVYQSLQIQHLVNTFIAVATSTKKKKPFITLTWWWDMMAVHTRVSETKLYSSPIQALEITQFLKSTWQYAQLYLFSFSFSREL